MIIAVPGKLLTFALVFACAWLALGVFAARVWVNRKGDKAITGQDLAYALIGLTAFLWVLGR